jgi:hypothetical protein
MDKEGILYIRALVNVLHASEVKCGFGVPFTPKNNPCECSHHDDYFSALAAIKEAESPPRSTVPENYMGGDDGPWRVAGS